VQHPRCLIDDGTKDLDVSGFSPIYKVHDIAHRNGKTEEDELITLTPEQM